MHSNKPVHKPYHLVQPSATHKLRESYEAVIGTSARGKEDGDANSGKAGSSPLEDKADNRRARGI